MNVWGLGELPQGQDYQVWLIEPDDSRVSGGIFQGSDEVPYVSVVIDSPERFSGITGIGITIEPEGGSPGPTGPRIFGVDL
jgi:anti-sigma-K factor RskA